MILVADIIVYQKQQKSKNVPRPQFNVKYSCIFKLFQSPYVYHKARMDTTIDIII